jgi:hypothetical protein
MTSDELRRICLEHAIPVSLAGFVRESDAARLLDVDVRTLQNWRRDMRGPECVRMGGAWRYSLAALAEFMTPTDESRKRRKEAETSVNDDCPPSRDHPAVQPRKVES